LNKKYGKGTIKKAKDMKRPKKAIEKEELEQLFKSFKEKHGFAGGGVAHMLGYANGDRVRDTDYSYLKDMDPEILKHFLKRLNEREMTKQADGGRIGFAEGGLDKIREAEKYATQKQTEFLKNVDIDNIPRTGNLQREQERVYENAYREYMERNTKADGGGIQKQAEEAMKEGFPKYLDEEGNEISLEKFLKDAAEADKKMVMPKKKPAKEVQKRKEKNFKKIKPALEKESADMVEDLIRSKKAGGGLMDLGGTEMDLRGGGFVPIGAKEKADDVPARLSKNEFVFTADAVRAAGGGSVEKGAQKMYNTMKQLEDSIA
jgi:hypothetical protein